MTSNILPISFLSVTNGLISLIKLSIGKFTLGEKNSFEKFGRFYPCIKDFLVPKIKKCHLFLFFSTFNLLFPGVTRLISSYAVSIENFKTVQKIHVFFCSLTQCSDSPEVSNLLKMLSYLHFKNAISPERQT